MKKILEAIKAIYATYFRRTKIFFMVQKFRLASGAAMPTKPEVPPEDRIRLSAKLIIEESFETVAAMFGNDGALLVHKNAALDLIASLPTQVDMVEVADGLGDVDYVSEFARQEFGIDGLPVAEEIQRANMNKFGSGSWVREDGKRMKPVGWQPPDIRGVLKAQGWDPSS